MSQLTYDNSSKFLTKAQTIKTKSKIHLIDSFNNVGCDIVHFIKLHMGPLHLVVLPLQYPVQGLGRVSEPVDETPCGFPEVQRMGART